MAIKASDISMIIKKQIKDFNVKTDSEEIGEIISVGDGIAYASGLENARLGEFIAFENENYGLVLNLEEFAVGIAIMGGADDLVEGQKVKRTGRVISTKVGDELIGRVLNSLGEPIDGLGSIKTNITRNIFQVAPGVMSRKEVNKPLDTGIIIIDSMIPIGKGQRELIIGDRQTGKTAIAIDTIINQKNKDVLCIYVAIGQKNSSIAQIVQKLKDFGAMEYTTIINSSASELSPLQYIAPYTGISIAEEWMSKGKDVLIIYDDLSKHAISYRTLSLLLRRPPGREAYPGDVFYLHSQLLERSARVTEEYGGGSITALPIVETQSGDISAYIPTNVISITDGQIFTVESLFKSGQIPAVDVGFSVSRVGSSAQIPAIKEFASSLKLELAQYNEVQAFAQFGSDLDESTSNILNHGERIYEILKQSQYSPISQFHQVIILLSIKEKLISEIPVSKIQRYRDELFNFIEKTPEIMSLKNTLENEKINDETKKSLVEILKRFIKDFITKVGQEEMEKVRSKLKDNSKRINEELEDISEVVEKFEEENKK